MTRASRWALLWQDVRDGLRGLKRRRLFTAVAVASLALGVGASTAMFSVVYGVLMRPIDLPNAGQVVLIGEGSPQIPDSANFAYFDTPSAFYAWQAQASDFSALAALQGSSFTLSVDGRPELLHGAHVTTNFFDVLGVAPQLGRLLAPSDKDDQARPMVITDRLWRRTFNADSHVLGRRIGPPAAEATVVGVLPPSFQIEGGELGPMIEGQATDYFDARLNIAAAGTPDATGVFSNFNYTVVGRLRPGVTREAALAQLNTIQANLASAAPDNPGPKKLTLYALVTPMRDYAVRTSRLPLLLLLAGVVAVLLIVCVNLGGLSVTRVADQRHDWAIRAALGAAPGRLARQMLAETIVLALVGGLVGIACAVAGLRTLIAAAPPGVPRLDQVRVDWRLFVFGVGASLLAGLVTGIVPALRLRRTSPQESLKATAVATTADRGSLRSRHGLIGVQAALSTVLLAIAGLLGVSLYRLVSQPTGFDADHAVAADVMLAAYPDDAQRDQVLKRLPAEAAALPGVDAVGLTSYLPLRGETWIDGISLPGQDQRESDDVHTNVRFVSAGYFTAIGVPILAGRSFSESDRPSGPAPASRDTEPPGVVVLSRATARILWPHVAIDELPSRDVRVNDRPMHVIGIAGDTRASLDTPAPATTYEPYWSQPPYSVSLVVRAHTSASTLATPLREAIWRVAPLAPIPKLRGLDDLESAAVATQRYQFTLLLIFAAVALLLAAMGVAALVAHSVARRRKELALRVTLGARSMDLWRLILGQALAPVGAGIVVGLIAAIASGRLLSALLFHVNPSSPIVLGLVAIAVIAAASLACVLSARRAIGAEPWPALRAE